MNLEISVDDARRVVVCTCTGRITMQDGVELTRAARRRAFELGGYAVLYDCSGATQAFTVAELYNLVRNPDRLDRPEHAATRAAVLAGADMDESFWRFYEDTAQNAGLDLRVFTDREAAMAWLAQR